MLEFVPDWFVTHQQLKLWHDNDDDEITEWYDGYQKRKTQKVKRRRVNAYCLGPIKMV